MEREDKAVSGTILDERVLFTLGEVCRSCGVSAELLIEMVDHGVAEPQGQAPAEWRFQGNSLVRVQRALRLRQDLGVNLPGVALALDLLEELERVRRRLECLERGQSRA